MYEDEHGVMYVNDDMSIYHVLGSFVHPGAVVYKDEHGVMYVNDDMSIYHVSGSFVHPGAVVYKDEHGVMYVNDDMSIMFQDRLFTLGLWCTRMNMV